MSNEGIIQYGGSINATNLVVGDHASIGSGSEKEEVVKILDQVIRKLSARETPGIPKENVVASIETIKAEIHKEKPNNVIINGIGTAVLQNLKNINDTEAVNLFQLAFDKIQR